jgi:hypothetical protein
VRRASVGNPGQVLRFPVLKQCLLESWPIVLESLGKKAEMRWPHKVSQGRGAEPLAPNSIEVLFI